MRNENYLPKEKDKKLLKLAIERYLRPELVDVSISDIATPIKLMKPVSSNEEDRMTYEVFIKAKGKEIIEEPNFSNDIDILDIGWDIAQKVWNEIDGDLYSFIGKNLFDKRELIKKELKENKI